MCRRHTSKSHIYFLNSLRSLNVIHLYQTTFFLYCLLKSTKNIEKKKFSKKNPKLFPLLFTPLIHPTPLRLPYSLSASFQYILSGLYLSCHLCPISTVPCFLKFAIIVWAICFRVAFSPTGRASAHRPLGGEQSERPKAGYYTWKERPGFYPLPVSSWNLVRALPYYRD